MSEIVKDDKKVIRAWALFDWANSSYNLVISTAIFPIYFLSITDAQIPFFGRMVESSVYYNYLVSIAFFVVAIFSPLMAGIADFGSKRKFFLRLFTTVGGLSCILLFFFQHNTDLVIGTIGFTVATIGHASSLVFYDAYLPDIASKEKMDSVSAKGYAYGYVGSVLLLIFIIFMSQKPEFFGISPEATSLPYRIGFALVGVWWIGFAQITFRSLPKEIKETWSRGLISRGYKEIITVAKELKTKIEIRKYLASFFFYSAGVQTIIYVATIFAEKELGFESAELIMIVLLLQLVAVIGAYIFARISKKTTNKTALIIAISIWVIICFIAYFVAAKSAFYMLAALVGVVLGGIQSVSRSTYSKIIDDGDDSNNTSYFSFYDVMYYLSVMFGTFVFGLVEQLTGNIRNSVLVLSLFFFIALVLMLRVDSGAIQERKAVAA